MILQEIIKLLENFVHPSIQESFDNSGLQVGNPDAEIKKVLVSLDASTAVIDEAIEKKCNLIITHHPLIYGEGLKSITGKTYTEKLVLKAIRNNIAIYSMHTNLDKVHYGVSYKMCEKLNLENIKILSPEKGGLKKLIVFCPEKYIKKIKNAMFASGAGHVGNYDSCSFQSKGEGSFRALDNARPFVGEIGKVHFEKELRVEVVFPAYKEHQIIKNMLEAHPYKEVAYDIYSIENTNAKIGFGMIGDLNESFEEAVFLRIIKKTFGLKMLKHTSFAGKKIKKIAVCGGSGAFLIKTAIAKKADAYISSDIKYHEFITHGNSILIADIGHFESEVFSKEIIFDFLKKKIHNFAVFLSEKEKNPVNYF